MSATADLARGLALAIGSRRATGIFGHPACRLFGESPLQFAARVGPQIERDVAVLLELLLRRLSPPSAEAVRRELGQATATEDAA
jgi:hypothetical protein